VLIFDEATSMLDAGTEREIIETIQRLTAGPGAGRLTLMISHRISIASSAHHLYVMAGGRIVDEGTHASLVSRPGLYAGLWREHEAGLA
jgi:ABC-type multidrug transport system fused ATPase/permease subunit